MVREGFREWRTRRGSVQHCSSIFLLTNTVFENTERNEAPPKKTTEKTEKVAARDAVIRGRKIWILPTKVQNKFLPKCLGIHCHVYNECVDVEKEGKITKPVCQKCTGSAGYPKRIIMRRKNRGKKNFSHALQTSSGG